MSAAPPVAALIVAAGRGARAGRPGPKQYERLRGSAVLARAHAAFARHPGVGRVLTVIHADDEEAFGEALPSDEAFVLGGADRQASVRLGLETLARDAPDIVLIHDGARPLIGAGVISAVLEALGPVAGRPAPLGALPALPVTDTLKRGAPGPVSGRDVSLGTHPREGLWRAQTPQGFAFGAILTAHRTAPAGSATDDASLLEAAGLPVALVPGDPANIKLTYPEDFAMADALLGHRTETRTGMGYDVHAFTDGDHVTLGGVRVPHARGLLGHSDADVAMHALTDALYGALGEGDIGRHFPPSDPQWRGAPSATFLRHAGAMLAARGGRVINADVTIVCEAPKVAPHAEAMRANLANALGCAAERVSVKATTTEGLGFEGRREGIAAHAVIAAEIPA